MYQNCALKKEKGPASSSRALFKICASTRVRHVLGLKTFWSFFHLEFDLLSLGQRFVPVHLNCGKMDENILARLPLNKTVPFGCVEPLHYTLLFAQLRYSSSRKVASMRRREVRRGRPSITRNARVCWHKQRGVSSFSFFGRLAEAANGGGFVGVDVEDGIELGELKKIADAPAEIEEL